MTEQLCIEGEVCSLEPDRSVVNDPTSWLGLVRFSHVYIFTTQVITLYCDVRSMLQLPSLFHFCLTCFAFSFNANFVSLYCSPRTTYAQLFVTTLTLFNISDGFILSFTVSSTWLGSIRFVNNNFFAYKCHIRCVKWR